MPGVITNEELANLPRYHCSSGAPTSHSSSSLSRIPRPTTPTKYKPSLVSRVLAQKSFNRRSPSKPVTPTPVIQDCHAYLRSLPPSQHVFADATPATATTATVTTVPISGTREQRLRPKPGRTSFFQSKPWK